MKKTLMITTSLLFVAMFFVSVTVFAQGGYSRWNNNTSRGYGGNSNAVNQRGGGWGCRGGWGISGNTLFSGAISEDISMNEIDDEMWTQVPGIFVPVMPMMTPELWGKWNAIELKSLHTDTDVYIYARWNDLSQNVSKDMWIKTADKWEHSPENEDRIGFAWDIEGSLSPFGFGGFGGGRGGMMGGCATLCHVDPDEPGKLTMTTAYTGGIADLWQWKAARTNPAGYADDQYFDTEDHKGDEGESSYSDNKSEDGETPAYMFAGDVEKSAYLFNDEAEFFDDSMFGEGDTLPGYILKTPSGDRADVKVVGVWADGYWTVVFKRSLQTDSVTDVQFASGIAYPFGVSIFDNAGDELHLKSRLLYLSLE